MDNRGGLIKKRVCRQGKRGGRSSRENLDRQEEKRKQEGAAYVALGGR